MPPDSCEALRRTQHRSHGALVWNAQAAAKHEEISDKQKMRNIILGGEKKSTTFFKNVIVIINPEKV